ncbi:hypothetical protein ACFQT0_30675 [Hymenobacter humi]|uniref:Uncharacterized protein n=1 Tax=Hymenobacter humi TaxID=1411620 RepID=A0ABW2UG27_9BACT
MRTVGKWTPERVEALTGVPAHKLQAAAEILGTCESLVSTALQGCTSPCRPPRQPCRSTTST